MHMPNLIGKFITTRHLTQKRRGVVEMYPQSSLEKLSMVLTGKSLV